jgi:hypothetical protein
MVSVEAFKRIGERIRLVKLEGIMRLRFDVYPYHFKSSAVISFGCTTGATEKVK